MSMRKLAHRTLKSTLPIEEEGTRLHGVVSGMSKQHLDLHNSNQHLCKKYFIRQEIFCAG